MATPPKLTKAQATALEKVFAAEIEGRLPFQSKAKIYPALEAAGLVEKIVITDEGGIGRFPIILRGYVLTHAGRYLYCAQCGEDETEEKGA